MEIKKKILKSLIGTDDDILYMASHHVFAYLWVIVITIVMVAITFFSYDYLKLLSGTFASWTTGILGIIIYAYFILNFLDIYLDAVVITKDSIVIYKWYGLFKSTTDVIEFHAIESVFSEQEGIINVLFNNGNIFLRRTSDANVFNDVHNPLNISDNINKIIRSKEAEYYEEEEKEEKEETKEKNDNDFNIFIEAMGEIIRDYKNK